MSHHQQGLIGLCLIFAIASASVRAEPVALPSANAAVEELPSLEALLQTTVFSASKRAQVPEAAPSMVSVITADTIRDFGWRTLAEALGSLRGVHVSNDRSYSYLGVRGFGRPGDYNSRVLLLIDGVPLNDSIYDQAPVGSEFSLDLALVERIEYVPGAGSVLYGGNALLAVVNVITKAGARVGTRLSAGAGSGMAGELGASHGWRDESGNDGLVSLTRERKRGRDLYFESYAAPGGDPWSRGLDHEANDRIFLQFRRAGFAGSLLLHEREKGLPGGSYGSDLNDPRNQVRDRRVLGSLRYEHQQSAATSWRMQGFAMDYRYDGTWVFGGVSQPDALVTRSLGGEVSVTTTAWAGHTLIGGVSWREDRQRRQFNPSLDVNVPRRALGLFVQDDVALADKVTLSAGLRYDKIRDADVDTAVSPRLALILQPQAGTVVKLIASNAFRPPNAYETDYAFAGTNSANPGLRKEHIRSTELGVEHAFGANTKVTGSLYHNHIHDLISLETDAVSGLQQHRNVGQVDASGLELEAVTQLGVVSLRGNVAWQRVRHDSGAEIANSPGKLAKVLVSMPVSASTRLGWETYYTGSRSAESGLISTTGERVRGHTVSHATLSGDFGRGVIWQLRVSNVFDRNYGHVVGTEFSASFPGVQVSPMPLMPQDGRRFYGSVRWHF